VTMETKHNQLDPDELRLLRKQARDQILDFDVGQVIVAEEERIIIEEVTLTGSRIDICETSGQNIVTHSGSQKAVTEDDLK